MKRISKSIARFKELTTAKKAEVIVASVLTASLLTSIPVFAWFNYQRRAAEMYKVKYPNSLHLSAAHREDSTCFEINGINADAVMVDGLGNKILDDSNNEQKITHKDYVFNVTGEAVDKFTIQLAYTTNNPFTYEVYAANELTVKPVAVAGQEIDYVEYVLTGNEADGMPTLVGADYHLDAVSGKHLFYQINTAITEGGAAGLYTGRYLNSTNGTDANDDDDNTYYNLGYNSYSNTHSDAKPVYWQANDVSAFPGTSNANKEAFSRHFILRVKWPAGALDNTAKETDILYISVKAQS